MALTNINWQPGTQELHRFATSLTVGFALIAVAVWILGGHWHSWRVGGDFHWRPLAGWWAPSLALLLLARIHAPLVKPFYRVWMGLAFIMGNLTGILLLGLFFYGVVTPFGLVLRLAGHDPLRLRTKAGATSYWIPRAKQTTAASRSRLF